MVMCSLWCDDMTNTMVVAGLNNVVTNWQSGVPKASATPFAAVHANCHVAGQELLICYAVMSVVLSHQQLVGMATC
jgi:hypothetical protein